jgi:hypothetical protein
MDQQRAEAMRLKAIFYSNEFLMRYGDWLSASEEFYSSGKRDQTNERRIELLKKHNITIEVYEQFEPKPTSEVMEFVYSEYYRIYSSNN